ncbi:flagellar basal body L-ring protein FlgH [Desulfonatronovibrio hydrogenovorans]|uniref:flagellar basal body L-ring protein FlgH n=2 Tax=Desulfonatronovibrio hydrogenovorans TaxID=53245 RepID=UPI0009FD74D2
MRIYIIIAAGIMLAACAPAQHKPTPMPSYSPEPYIDSMETVEMDSPSLFNRNRSEFLFSDNRARNVGDLVMVNILEDTEAKNEADTTANRRSSVNLGVEHFMNRNSMHAIPLDTATGGLLPGLGPRGTVGEDPMIQAGSTSNFQGTGETNRESFVRAIISARVVRVLDGGVLQIEGARNIKVNGENQIIVVRGLARSRDVGPNNSIDSTQLADAHIEVYGQGILADKQKPGWLARLLDKVWPF